DATEALQRLGAAPAEAEERVLTDAGIDTWRVVVRGGRYFALDERFPRLSIPIEMMGSGEPKLLEWQLKEPPFKGIGTLRYYGGSVPSPGKAGAEDMELVAVVDLDMGHVLAVEPHKLGSKVATWTWDNGKVTVASVDGVTDEIELRYGAPDEMAGGGRRYTTSTETGGWAPWDTPFGGTTYASPPPKRKKKTKTIFDLLFN
ncbi:MAG: hypothetical protein AB7S70_11575, partial [Hyphomicrobium sp.]